MLTLVVILEFHEGDCFMKNILMIVFILVFVIGCRKQEISLTSPENTIQTYYNALAEKDLRVVNQCYAHISFSKEALGQFWESYSITNIKKLVASDIFKYEEEMRTFQDDSSYQYFINNRQKYKLIDDVEIIVTYVFSKKDSPYYKSGKTLYLLRNIDGKWKILWNYATEYETWDGKIELPEDC
jgi:hypothetical protein